MTECAHGSLEQSSEHPLAAAIVSGAKAKNLALESVADFRSVTGGGVFGRVANKAVLVGKPNFLRAEGVTELGTLETRAEQLQQSGQTVIFVPVYKKAAGLLAVADPVKSTTPDAIRDLHALGIPVAAGLLYPFFGVLLSPMIAGVAMSLSSVSVITNALRLRKVKL